MRTNLANSVYQSIGDTVRCPQCETVSKHPPEPGHIACPQCGFRFCPECHYYRRRLGADFCLACGVPFSGTTERPVRLPGYLEQYVARSVSLINIWFVAWLTLSIGGGPLWFYAFIGGTFSLYWMVHFWRFRQRTGLIQASRYIGGIGLSVTCTIMLLILLQFWLIHPPVNWQSIELWAFILAAVLIMTLGMLWPPAVMQARFGAQIVSEATTFAARWSVLERMRYRDMLLLRIPDVRHIPAASRRPGV